MYSERICLDLIALLFAWENLIVSKLSHHVSLNIITEWFQTILNISNFSSSIFSNFHADSFEDEISIFFKSSYKFFVFSFGKEKNYFSFYRRSLVTTSTASENSILSKVMIKIEIHSSSRVKLLITETEIEILFTQHQHHSMMCREWTNIEHRTEYRI